jgi:hypothetical protein
MINKVPGSLLRGHITYFAFDESFSGLCVLSGCFGYPKIDNLHFSFIGDQDIHRVDVSVYEIY